jgi:hypothetical protein
LPPGSRSVCPRPRSVGSGVWPMSSVRSDELLAMLGELVQDNAEGLFGLTRTSCVWSMSP